VLVPDPVQGCLYVIDGRAMTEVADEAGLFYALFEADR
jgi:hypothetical protein